MHSRQFIVPFLVCFTIFVLEEASLGQELYSYLDENGIQVYTNIPPVDRVAAFNSHYSPDNVLTSGNSRKISEASESVDSIIEKYALEYELDPSLIRSIIAVESAFNPMAVSSKGARGLMQLMPETAERLGVSDPFDPDQNIRAGVRHFRSLLDTFNNNLILSLAAYNAGENLVQRLGRVPAIRETHDYIRFITLRYGKGQLDDRTPEARANPSTFRYIDEAGVLHLTNIPPIVR
jgi:soluble lytic murein transglycosylase-like protein